MKKQLLYKRFAKYYDLIFLRKPYAKEANFIDRIIKKHNKHAKTILDVGCGTGNHIVPLRKKGYSLVGLDFNKEMFKIAKRKLKKTKFVLADMRDFKLKEKFDVIICMFGAIRYNLNHGELKRTLRNFYYHLNKNGIVIFEIGVLKENWINGVLNCRIVKTNNIKIGVLDSSYLKSNRFYIVLIYLISSNGKVYYYIDDHAQGLFEFERIKNIMKNIGSRTFVYDGNFSLKTYKKKSKKGPIFVGIKT